MKPVGNDLFSLSIVLPTYNERDNVRAFIPLLEEKFTLIPHEIIVVDDSSPDGTGKEVLSLRERFPSVRLHSRKEKKGIGSALRCGYNEARLDIILSSDADLSLSVDDLMKIYDKVVAGYDLVVGSRHSPLSFYEKRKPPIFLKYLISRSGNFLLKTFFHIPVNDFSLNCRAIRRKVWQKLETKENTNFFLFEMIFLSMRKGFRIAEVPVAFADRKHGTSKINHLAEALKALYKMMVYLLMR